MKEKHSVRIVNVAPYQPLEMQLNSLPHAFCIIEEKYIEMFNEGKRNFLITIEAED